MKDKEYSGTRVSRGVGGVIGGVCMGVYMVVHMYRDVEPEKHQYRFLSMSVPVR